MGYDWIQLQYTRVVLGAMLIFGTAVTLSTLACAPRGATGPGVLASMELGATHTPEDESAPGTDRAERGEWESSGGDGVACFETGEEAHSAEQELKSTGALSRKTREWIRSIVTLEEWDYLAPSVAAGGLLRVGGLRDFATTGGFSLESSLSGLNAQQALDKIATNIGRFTPLFAQRIEMVRARVPLAKWAGADKVPQVDDSKPKRELDPNCVLVQLAHRATKSKAERIPETKIIYDRELYGRLSETGKALLMAHEYLYLVGKEGGHANSDDIRRFNAFLFSHQAFDFGPQGASPSHQAHAMRQIVGYPFGDYMRFFIDESELKGQAPAGSGYSRHKALLSLMTKMRASMSSCLDRNGYVNGNDEKNWRIRMGCQMAVVDKNPALWKSLTPEEAFVYLGRFHFDQIDWELNSEFLQTWDPADPRATAPKQAELARRYCREIPERPAVQFLEVQERAARYCRETIGVDVKSLTQLPLRTFFSCFSRDHTFIWHHVGDHPEPRPSIKGGIDAGTGAPLGPMFAGKAELVSTTRAPEQEDVVMNGIKYVSGNVSYGFGNERYRAERVYRLSPVNTDDQKLIAKAFEAEPHAFVRMEVALNGSGAPRVTTSLEEAKSLLATPGAEMKNADVRFEDCLVTETNLPDRAWWSR